MKSVLSILLFLTIIGMPAAASASPLGLTPSQRATQRAELIQIIRKVNDHWQTQHPVHGDAFWNRAAYHTGNMAAFKATAHQPYRDYSEAWAKKINGKAQNPTSGKIGNTPTGKAMTLCSLAIGKPASRFTSTSITSSRIAKKSNAPKKSWTIKYPPRPWTISGGQMASTWSCPS
jgi:hypothetical protein